MFYYEQNRIICTKYFVHLKPMIMLTRFRLLVPVSIAALSITLFAFQKKIPLPPHAPVPPAPPALADTVPAPPKAPAAPRIADFDDARRELKRAAAELEESVKNMHIPEPEINAAEIKAQVEKALQSIDAEKINAQVAQSMKSVEVQKGLAQAQAEIAKIDAAALKKEVDAAMKDVEKEMAEVQKELAKIQKQDFAKVQQELKNLKPKIEAELKDARAELAKAKKELDVYEAFVNDLAADGLLSKEAYTIEHKEGKFYINDKEQSAAVYNKYRSFLNKHQKLKITKNEEGLNIRN